MDRQKRNPAADIVRCFALFCVISVHFFLNNGYYNYAVTGWRMLALTVLRSFFMVCVPLFITLSGYLLRGKELSVKYYARIGKILVTYFLCSILCMVFSVVVLRQKLTPAGMVLKLLNFSGAPYAWYIEMYLGLFLLIPFLNILYRNIPTQKWKLCLVLTCIALTALPTVINAYQLSLSAACWFMPAGTGAATQLFPAWWSELYPITYYFIGCYLSEYGIKIKASLNAVLILVCTLLSGLFSYWQSYGTVFAQGPWADFHSLFSVVLTVLVFVWITNRNWDRCTKKTARVLHRLSDLCLGGYLVSWIWDSVFYPILLRKVPSVPHTLEFFLLIVPVVYVLSLAVSFVVSKLQQLLEYLCGKLAGLLRKRGNFTKSG